MDLFSTKIFIHRSLFCLMEKKKDKTSQSVFRFALIRVPEGIEHSVQCGGCTHVNTPGFMTPKKDHWLLLRAGNAPVLVSFPGNPKCGIKCNKCSRRSSASIRYGGGTQTPSHCPQVQPEASSSPSPEQWCCLEKVRRSSRGGSPSPDTKLLHATSHPCGTST